MDCLLCNDLGCNICNARNAKDSESDAAVVIKFRVGDRVWHKKADCIGYIKKIYGDKVATIEHRDKPMVKTCRGSKTYPTSVCSVGNLELSPVTHSEVVRQLEMFGCL